MIREPSSLGLHLHSHPSAGGDASASESLDLSPKNLMQKLNSHRWIGDMTQCVMELVAQAVGQSSTLQNLYRS